MREMHIKITKRYNLISFLSFYLKKERYEVIPYELQAGIKIGRRNINNLRYEDDTTLIAENKEELKTC